VEESTAYGSPALKVRGKLLACVPVHRSAEPGSPLADFGKARSQIRAGAACCATTREALETIALGGLKPSPYNLGASAATLDGILLSL